MANVCKKSNSQSQRVTANDKPYILQCSECGASVRRKKHGAFKCDHCKGIRKYPYGWPALRRKVLARDGGCVVCGRNNVSLHIHHIDSNTKNNKGNYPLTTGKYLV